MKPNDKAIEAAIAEGKRWGENLIRKENQIPYWNVLRQADDKRYGYDVIAKFNNPEDRNEALERLRAEAMVTAAYAAQFQSEDYAGLVKDLRSERGCIASPDDCLAAADALEVVLAERDALKAGNNELREENENLKAANRYGKDWVDNASQDITRLRADLAAVTAERDRMREALEFYGWAEHWVKQPYERSVIEDDKGRRARAALEGVAPASPWRDIESAPKDGTPIEGSELYRYLPYKPEGRRQMKAVGRWQRWNGYGWENSEPPQKWKLSDKPTDPPR